MSVKIETCPRRSTMPGLIRATAVIAFIAAAFITGSASAQSWPERSGRIITGAGPGSVPDIVARMVGERMTRAFGRPFIVENVMGGGGLIAAQNAARAAPDGYTFFTAGVGFIATDRYMFKSVPYDTDRDFVPVAMLYDSAPFAIAVRPDLPVRTVAELIALAKAQPGKLSSGSDSVGVTAIVGQWFNKVTGADITLVPYKTVAQMLADAVGGSTHMVFNSVANVDSFRKAGKLRVIGISADRRLPFMADIPTIGETVPGFKIVGVGIMAAPAGTPPSIVQRVNREMDAFEKEPAYTERLQSFGIATSGAGTPQSIAEFIRAERALWDQVLKGLNVQPQ
jgi:tripartite-type tricarboxylate transporter receptor subunit TctC